jgi:hypothetical protein
MTYNNILDENTTKRNLKDIRAQNTLIVWHKIKVIRCSIYTYIFIYVNLVNV